MKKYIALLRGVNISGKNKIAMPELKGCFEEAGFSDVSTYLNSGNVKFSTDVDNSEAIIETRIKEKFGLEIPVYVIEIGLLNDILENAPTWWNSGDKSKYDNLIFILSDDYPEDIYKLVGGPTENLEQIQIYQNVIFWTFDTNKYQKCNWWKKTASKEIANRLTIRTANTIERICK